MPRRESRLAAAVATQNSVGTGAENSHRSRQPVGSAVARMRHGRARGLRRSAPPSRATLLAGTWPDRSIGCAARTKTHRKSTTRRLLTAMTCSDPVCARAVRMLYFSVAEVFVESVSLVIHLHLRARAHDHSFGTRACRMRCAWVGARAWAGGRAHVAAVEGSWVPMY